MPLRAQSAGLVSLVAFTVTAHWLAWLIGVAAVAAAIALDLLWIRLQE